MVRKLKYHEKKLLKKVDFLSWSLDNNLAEVKAMRRYRIQRREDYQIYTKLSLQVRTLVQKLKDLPPKDPLRVRASAQLVEKLHSMGLIADTSDFNVCRKVNAISFCRRRLPVQMVRLRMTQNLQTAIKFIEQGHVRVGAEVVTDPAFLVSRNLGDYVTWTDTSKIKRQVMEYNDERDDFDLAM